MFQNWKFTYPTQFWIPDYSLHVKFRLSIAVRVFRLTISDSVLIELRSHSWFEGAVHILYNEKGTSSNPYFPLLSIISYTPPLWHKIVIIWLTPPSPAILSILVIIISMWTTSLANLSDIISQHGEEICFFVFSHQMMRRRSPKVQRGSIQVPSFALNRRSRTMTLINKIFFSYSDFVKVHPKPTLCIPGKALQHCHAVNKIYHIHNYDLLIPPPPPSHWKW